jgi:hypothetical protein
MVAGAAGRVNTGRVSYKSSPLPNEQVKALLRQPTCRLAALSDETTDATSGGRMSISRPDKPDGHDEPSPGRFERSHAPTQGETAASASEA